MAITPEHVLNLAQKISDAKNALSSLQKEWDGIFGGINAGAKPAARRTREKRSDSTPAQIIKLLKSSTESLDAMQIAAAIGKPVASIRKVLQKLFGEQRIERAERGKYCAPQGAPE